MRLRLRAAAVLLVAAIALFAEPSGAWAQRTAVDDRGRQVTLQAPARRIVALAPHITELVFAAGAGSRLVGVSRYSDFPPAAAAITEVGDSGRADLERILELKPDLVVGWRTGGTLGDLVRLEKLGIPVFVTEPRRLTDIPRLLRELGQLAGTREVAEREALNFERGLNDLARRYADARPVTVFYQIWHRPLMTVNGEHMIADVIRLCGGRNVFEELSAFTPVVGAESLLATDPEVIIASVSALEVEKEVRGFWSRFPRIRAVAASRLAFVHPDLIQRQTPRILEGARQVCEALERARSGG